MIVRLVVAEEDGDNDALGKKVVVAAAVKVGIIYVGWCYDRNHHYFRHYRCCFPRAFRATPPWS